jgi:RHS repeat-associated protein
VRLITDNSGNVISRHDYEPFGVEIAPVVETANNTHRFTGHERDASTGYDYMHYRSYGSNLGRFMKPDNITGNPLNPQSWNLYSYVRGNPVNFNDPTGHQEKEGEKGKTTSSSSDANMENPTTEVSEKQDEEGIIANMYDKFANFCKMMGQWAKVELLGLTSTERGSSSQAKESYQLGAPEYLDNAPKSGAQLKDAINKNTGEIVEKGISKGLEEVVTYVAVGSVAKKIGALKVPVSGLSAKEAAKDAPSWAKGLRPTVSESGKDFAKRLCDAKYGVGKYNNGPGSEFSQIKKWADRAFKDP